PRRSTPCSRAWLGWPATALPRRRPPPSAARWSTSASPSSGASSAETAPRGHYSPRVTDVLPRPSRPRQLSVVVIGAGFGGLAAAVELRRRGVTDITILEKADDVGGVWRDNTYPGAACDVPSSLYSY